MQELEWLGDRISALLKRYNNLRKMHRNLKRKAEAQEAEINDLRNKLARAEQEIMAVKIGQLLPGEGEKERVRKQLDAVISDIDKLLTGLE